GQSDDRARKNGAPERRPGAEPSARGATMKVDVSAKPLVEASGDALVLDCYAGDDRTGSEMRRVDVTLGGVLALALRDLRFEGRVAEVADVHTGGRFPAKRILVVGLGPRAECTAEALRRAAAAAARRARDLGAGSVAIPVLGSRAPGLSVTARAQATAEGVRLGFYRFDRSRAKRNGDGTVSTVTVLVPAARDRAPAREGLRRAELSAEATCLARDLINEPANSVTASSLAGTARAIAKESGLRLRVLDRAACEKMGMGAFL